MTGNCELLRVTHNEWKLCWYRNLSRSFFILFTEFLVEYVLCSQDIKKKKNDIYGIPIHSYMYIMYINKANSQRVGIFESSGLLFTCIGNTHEE